MSRICRFKLRLVLLATLVAALAVFAQYSSSPPVRADLVDEGVACWVTGPLGGEDYDEHESGFLGVFEHQGVDGWGGEHEFTIDQQDFWSLIELGDESLKPVTADAQGREFLLSDELEDWGYFSSFPEAVDFTFAMYKSDLDFYEGVPNSKGKDLHELMSTGSRPGQVKPPAKGAREQIPFTTPRSYAYRRAVASYYDDLVHSFTAEWLDPYSPSGGSDVDYTSFLGDLAGTRADLTAATTETVGSGSRLENQQGVNRVTTIGGNNTFKCDQGASCVMTNSLQSGQADAQFRATAVHTSNQEVFTQDVDPDGERTAEDEKGDPVDVPAGAAEHRDKSLYRSGYGELFQENTEADKIHITIELDPANREDYEWKLLNDNNFSRVYIQAMGSRFTNWTLPNYGNQPSLTAFAPRGVSRDSADEAESLTSSPRQIDANDHFGYRQPTLGTAYAVDGNEKAPGYVPNYLDNVRVHTPASDGSYSDGMQDFDRLRWPVNLEDLNWYLYDLPGKPGGAYGHHWDNLYAFWLSDDGSNWLLGSGYGTSNAGWIDGGSWPPADPENPGVKTNQPYCYFEDPEQGEVVDGTPTPDDAIRAVAAVGKAKCEGQEVDTDELLKGALGGVYYAFNVGNVNTDLHNTLDFYKQLQGSDDYPERTGDWTYAPILVRAGVSRPVDAEKPFPRRMNRFSFAISEELEVGDSAFSRNGGFNLKTRYGVPLSPKHAAMFYDEWPNGPIDPNKPYLMVVTYYESLRDGKNTREFRPASDSLEILADPKNPASAVPVGDTGIRIPERHIRRVICRMVVYPAGYSPLADDSNQFFWGLFDDLGKKIKSGWESLKGAFISMFTAIAKVPGWFTKETVEASCDGIGVVEEYTSTEDSENLPLTTVNSQGQLENNQAALARQASLDDCAKASVEETPTCFAGADAIVDGQCISLPQMELKVNPSGSRFFRPIPKSAAEDPEYRGAICWPLCKEHGLEYLQRGGEERFFRPFDWYANPDLEPTPFEMGLSEIRVDFDFAWGAVDNGLYNGVDGYMVEITPDPLAFDLLGYEGQNGALNYVLPHKVHLAESLSGGSLSATNSILTIDGFWVGALDQHHRTDRALAHPSATGLNHPSVGNENYVLDYRVVGSSTLDYQFDQFNAVVGRLPLAPGFVHKFRMAPYFGTVESDLFEVGPFSEYLVLDGSIAACDALSSASGTSPNNPPTAQELNYYRDLYDCPDVEEVVGEGFYDDDDYRVGLLSLAGSEVCGDIFSSTPAHFTWDSEVVQRVWLLMWIIAGSVLFVLLVWQAFKMTYDIWLEPSPSVGFREMVPRFLAAVGLAAGSLFLCKWILILCNDITCFVAQTTGMSMWGFIGATFLSFVHGFFDLWLVWLKTPYTDPGAVVLGLLLNGLIVLFLLIILLILFLKVAFGMLTRIAMLAVLIAFAPLAFAFFASPQTSHWTKKWISMFLGTAFQQVVVLIVIYIGGHLIAEYARSVDDSFFVFIVGIILGLMVLAVADKAPSLVNPVTQGAGLFGGFGEMMKMGLAGTALVVGAAAGGIGAVAGGAAASGGAAGGGGGLAGLSGGGGGVAGLGGAVTSTPGAAVGSAGSVSSSSASTGAVSGLKSSGGASGSGSGLGSRVFQGMRKGVQGAQRFNRQSRDIMEGRFLYQNNSMSDDAANRSQERAASNNRMSDSIEELSQSIRNINAPKDP